MHSLYPRRPLEHGDRQVVQAAPWPAAADALQADPRAFDHQEDLVGEALGPRITGLAHESDQALALPALVRLDDAPRGMLALGELDRRVGERAAAALALGGELGDATQEKSQLRFRIFRMRGARLVPHRFAFGGERLQVRGDQLVSRAEVPIE